MAVKEEFDGRLTTGPALLIYLGVPVLAMFLVPFAGPVLLVLSCVVAWLRHERPYVCWVLTVLAVLTVAMIIIGFPV